jgi:hypothetical protein
VNSYLLTHITRDIQAPTVGANRLQGQLIKHPLANWLCRLTREVAYTNQLIHVAQLGFPLCFACLWLGGINVAGEKNM